MLTSKFIRDLRNRQLVSIPRPIPILDAEGKPILKNNTPIFTVKPQGAENDLCRSCNLTDHFVQMFVIGKERTTMTRLVVLCELARTLNWAKVHVLVDEDSNPILDINERGQAVFETFGNRSATRGISELANRLNLSYGAVQKALKFWIDIEIMREIKPYPAQRPKKPIGTNGRPEKSVRYEFDPRYVWNGYRWLAAALDYELSLKNIQIVGV